MSCSVGQFSTAGASTCSLCASGTYSSQTAASSCSICSNGTYAISTSAATSTAPLTWLYRNPVSGTYFLNLPNPGTGIFQGSPDVGVNSEPTYWPKVAISTVLRKDLTSIQLSTNAMSGTCSSSTFDTTFAQSCVTLTSSLLYLAFGYVGNCNGANPKAIIDFSGTPFGVAASTFVACDASPTPTTSCTSASYCSVQVSSGNGGCSTAQFTGVITVLNTTWFNQEINQACALYGSSSNLQCSGTEVSATVATSPCLQCANGLFSTVGSTTCSECQAGTYMPATQSACIVCPAGSTSAAGTGDSISKIFYSPPLKQYSASSFLDGQPMASSVVAGFNLDSAGAWIPATAEYILQRSWVQLDMLSAVHIKAIVTQGMPGVDRWVMKLNVNASMDGSTWTIVARNLPANSDSNTKVVNSITTTFARYVRVIPMGFHRFPAMRLGVQLGLSGCSCMPGYMPAINLTSLSECQVCVAGYYCLGNTPIICPAGSYSASAATTCTACAAGTYSFSGSSSCLSCPANSLSQAAASACTVNAGFYNMGYGLIAYYSFNPSNILMDSS